MNPKVDFYFEKADKWQDEVVKLRTILSAMINEGAPLTEELKWGVPCYVFEKNNIVLIHTFKAYCALLFFKGALLKDPKQILVQQTKNVQAARQLRFTDLREIIDQEKMIETYINEAIAIEKAGLKVEMKETKVFEMPDEFRSKLKQIPKLKTAFETLTPGRQRAYLLYFSSAKQAKTRESRIEKYLPIILNGKGLDD